MLQITDKEKQLIGQLREKVSNVWKDEYLLSDANLYNWLRLKNWKLDKAEKAIHKNIKWRSDNKIDGILNEKFDDFYMNLKFHLDGFDKQGRIVATSYVNQVDPKEALDYYLKDKEQGERFAFFRAEFAFQEIKKHYFKTNGKINSTIAIVDCQGLKLKPFMAKLIELVPRAGPIAKQLEKNYPGLGEKVFVINAPNKVNTLFTMMKPFLTADTVKRVKFYGKKSDKWKEDVLAEINPDQLRKRYGGTRPDDS